MCLYCNFSLINGSSCNKILPNMNNIYKCTPTNVTASPDDAVKLCKLTCLDRYVSDYKGECFFIFTGLGYYLDSYHGMNYHLHFFNCNSIGVRDLIYCAVGYSAQGLWSRNDLAMSARATVFILSRFVDFRPGVLRSAWQNMVWNMYDNSGTHAVCTIAFSLIPNNGCRG